VADGAVKGESPANLFVRFDPVPISNRHYHHYHTAYHNAERVGGGLWRLKRR
jgi:hypothetical protein